MKTIFTILLASVLAVSCSGNDDTSENPQPAEKNVHNFEYKNYHLKNIVLYKGPIAHESDPGESYLNNYWNSYKEPIWKKISVDTKSNLIKLLSGTSADVSYPIKVSKDSLFIINNNELKYIGTFNQKEPSFTLKRTFQYVKKVPRNNSTPLFVSRNSTFGISQYTTIFGNSSFTTPSEMTEPGDEVLWSNIEYDYKAL
ncbi:hypothetical protein [Chryseobacterium paludis]|uniref:hypothetical protein n=1 Tax=Chryseobacterium paludis TaxID=2956784 RepID=UPI0021C1E146|nr:hypothetical protein [Chryseobacterium paludis]